MSDRFQQHVAHGRAPQPAATAELADDPAQPKGYEAVRRIRSFHFSDVIFRQSNGAPHALPWAYLRGWLGNGRGTRLTLLWPEMAVSLSGRHLDLLEEDIMRRIVAEFRQASPSRTGEVAAGAPIILTMDVEPIREEATS